MIYCALRDIAPAQIGFSSPEDLADITEAEVRRGFNG